MSDDVTPVVFREDVSRPLPPSPFPMGERRADDARNELFLMADVTPPTPLEALPTYRYWGRYDAAGTADPQSIIANTPLNQSNAHRRDTRAVRDPYGAGHCTGYAAKGLLLAYPTVNKALHLTGSDLYFLNQDRDEWNEPTDQYGQEPYQGSSMNAAMKTLRDLGFINAWVWGRTIEEVYRWVLERGPVCAATNWKTGMFGPRREKCYVLDVSGSNAGGHMYLIDGANRQTKLFRIANSWGAWGANGRAYIREADLARLMSERSYPIATPTELRRP